MADPVHVAAITEGVESWNPWVATQSERFRANLEGADLAGAKLVGADLAGADLRRAALAGADLRRANLREAKLGKADLAGAHLLRADLTGANLRRANLLGTDLREVNLAGAQLGGSRVGYTSFGNVDLSRTSGLDSVDHRGPSTIGVDTLYLTGPWLPRVFLEGCGVPALFIDYIDSFVTPVAFEYQSCFLSYNHLDELFADRLCGDLKAKGVRVWQDKHEMVPGDHLDDHLDRAIRKSERVLVVCSANSLDAENVYWVDRELSRALAIERAHRKATGERLEMIIPIDLDGHLFSNSCDYSRAEDLRDRIAARFTDRDAYVASLSLVLKALRNTRIPGVLDLRLQTEKPS